MNFTKELYQAWKYRKLKGRWTFCEWFIYRLYRKYIYPKFRIGED